MRPYLAIVSARFRMLLQYRAAALAGLWTQIFFGFVLIMVYEAFYRSTDATPPLPFPQLASYVWLGQALLATLPWNADPEIRAMVRSGAVAYELCRPVDLYALWYARALAWRTAPTLLRAAPMVIFSMAVLPWLGFPEWRLAPPTALAGLGFALTLTAALALSCAITTLVHITLMWTVSGEGIVMLLTAIVSLASGLLIPLPLFPRAIYAILTWLPFAGVADLPYRVYSGSVPAGEIGLVLARQVGWTLVLVALGRWLLGRGIRRLVVQGG